MMKSSDSFIRLAIALIKAQKEIINPKKKVENDFFNAKYADLAEVINVTKPALTNNGLVVIQMPFISENMIKVETTLLHESGEFISSVIAVTIDKKGNAQAIGSAITYARRYALSALLGIAQEDDDGGNSEDVFEIDQDKPEVKEKEAMGYPKKDFDRNFDEWKMLLSKGKITIESLINKLETRGSLTKEQISKIKGINNEGI